MSWSIINRSVILGPFSSGAGSTQAEAFVGAGDILSNVTALYGMRAYSNATIGTARIRLYNATTTAQQDIATIAGGGLDTDAADTVLGGAVGLIAKFYDPTGGGKDLAPVGGVTNGATYTTTTSPNGTPIASFNGTSNAYSVASFSTSSQPFSWIWVGATLGVNNVVRRQFDNSTGNCLANRYLDDTYGCYAGGTQGLDGPAAAGTGFYAQGLLFNGTSSVEYLNGSLVGNGPGRDIGSNFVNAETLFIGSAWDGTFYFSGPMCEFGFCTGDQTANFVSLAANQQAYWSF
jgi:hypothetical protein